MLMIKCSSPPQENLLSFNAVEVGIRQVIRQFYVQIPTQVTALGN